MNKQIAANNEKKSSFFRRSSLNATNLVSTTLRAFTGHSPAAPSSSNVQHSEVSTSDFSKDNAAIRNLAASVATTIQATPVGQSTAMDGCTTSAAFVTASEVLPLPQVCTSFPHGLSTINERCSIEDDSLQNRTNEMLDGSRTSSSCSMPGYLCHKMHTVTVNVPTDTNTDTAEDLHCHTTAPLEPSVARQDQVPYPCSSASRLGRESCDSSTSTTTSESYRLGDLPPLPVKLATLNKPSSQALIASALRSRKARHSIDVRSLPSYLARKRQSTFGQFLSGSFHFFSL